MDHCSPASEDSTLALSERELELCGRVKLTPNDAEAWKRTFLTPSGSPTSRTAAESTVLILGDGGWGNLPAFVTISHPLTSSAEDSPAKTFPTPESEPESTGNAQGCGASMPGSFASYDPATSSWRTSQLC